MKLFIFTYRQPQSTRIYLSVLLALLSFTGTALALPGQLNGNIQLSYSDSKTDDFASSSLTQNYSTSWTGSMGPYISLRAGLQYYDLGIDQDNSREFWRKQFQPSGEFVWNHPGFIFNSSLRRAVSSNNNKALDLVRDNIGINFKSRWSGLPILNVRFENNDAYNKEDRSLRDTRDRRLQTGLKYQVGENSFIYNLALNRSDNFVTDLNVSEVNHLFRWGHTYRNQDNRLQIMTNYSFNHRSQKTEQPSGSQVLQTIPVFQGLYGYDISAEIDPLNAASSLTDGVTDIAVTPPIDIGENSLDQNIGVDFGYIRDVDALYIYTDRPSDISLNWQVYISNDNYTWEPISPPASAVFDVALNRYNIYFEQQTARYIKAVNTSYNEIASVLVTEIEALSSSDVFNGITRDMASHTFDLASRYRFSDVLTTSFDFSLRRTPVSDYSNSPEQTYYSLSARHLISKKFTQNISFQAGYDRFSASSAKNKNISLSYNLNFDPLDRLDFSLSASSRSSYLDDLHDSETHNILLGGNGAVFDGLNLAAEVGYNRNNRFGGLPGLTTWNYRVSGDAWLTRWLNTTFSHGYQMTEPAQNTPRRTRRQYSVDYNLRMTGSIFFRGKYSTNRDEDLNNTLQEYSLNWNMSSRLTGGATYYNNENNRGTSSERYSARLNYKISSRSTIYVSYTSTEFTQAGLQKTSSFQAGLRTGF